VSSQRGLGGFGIGGGLATSRSVGQPLANDAPDGLLGAFNIIDPDGGPGVVAEIEFGEIPVKMAIVAVLINAAHPSFEHRKKSFCGVHVRVAARPFLFAVIDGFMAARKSIADMAVCRTFIGHQPALTIGVLHNDAAQSVGAQIISLDRAGLAAALDKGDDLHTIGGAAVEGATT